MAILKCKMCGGDLVFEPGATVCECEYCGSKQTIPNADNEKKMTLFARANRLLRSCEFDKAEGVFSSIAAEFPEEAEAYWGMVLCKYGIEYVDDPVTGKKIPTCHRSSFDSVMDDADFDQVMEYADTVARTVYREQAKQIEELRKGIIEVSGKEEPYDIFICYKETAEDGQRTIDSVLAQDIYDALTARGYRVFFSRISLEDKLGTEYEPYIFAALNSAKVMLAFGTSYEYYNAVWVKNEWSRFLKLMAANKGKYLIPCYKDIDAYDIPKEFAKLQAQNLGKVGATQDLLRGIGKIVTPKANLTTNISYGASSTEKMMIQRGNMALEDGDFKGAESFFERALDVNPSEAQAHLGKFMAAFGMVSINDMEDKVFLLDDNKEFRRAEQFADASLKEKLKYFRNANELKIQRLRLLDVLRKFLRVKKIEYLEKKIEYLENMKKSAYEHIIRDAVNGEKKAKEIYQDLMMNGFITLGAKSNYVQRIPIVKDAILLLSDCETHPSSAISTERVFNRYARADVRDVLKELVDYKFVKLNGLGYSLADAKERKDRLLKEKEEKRQREIRQKSAYEKACAVVNKHIQDEVDLRANLIFTNYDSRFNDVQQALEKDIAENRNQRTNIEQQISDWRSQQSSLGFFKGKEKKALQIKIDEALNRLNALTTQQEIQAKYQVEINRIEVQRNQEIDSITAEVKARNPLPKYEDFEDIVSENIQEV